MTLSPLVNKEVTKIRFKTLESDFNKIHNFKYDYSKAIYRGRKQHILICCPSHGEFSQTPERHLSGSGCRKCSGTYKPTLQEFIAAAQTIHKDKYDYSEFIYINKDKVGIIKCNRCGTTFTQSPHNHVYHSKGCKVCNSIIKSQNPTRLYYVTFLFNNSLYYKVGKTIHSLEKRFGADMKNIINHKSIVLSSGKEAYEIEQFILAKFKQFKYNGVALIKDGNSEIFTVDIWKHISEYFEKG